MSGGGGSGTLKQRKSVFKKGDLGGSITTRVGKKNEDTIPGKCCGR